MIWIISDFLERMLHRGNYNLDGDKKERLQWSPRTVFIKLLGITREYMAGDKVIAWALFLYSFVKAYKKYIEKLLQTGIDGLMCDDITYYPGWDEKSFHFDLNLKVLNKEKEWGEKPDSLPYGSWFSSLQRRNAFPSFAHPLKQMQG